MRVISSMSVLLMLGVSLVWTATPAAAHTTHSISIADFAFSPAAMTIEAGDTVTWTNSDQAPHDVTVTKGPVAIHSPMLAKGEHWSFTFTTAGTYSYICSIHPDMQATLTVAAHPETHPTSHAASPAGVTGAATPSTHTAPTSEPSSHHASTHPATPTSTPAKSPTSSSAPVAAAASGTPPTSAHPLKPLLLLAGLVAAVATFCLLVLASRPEETEAA